MSWTPVDPVPTTPTRFPDRSTTPSGHLPVCSEVPVKRSIPGIEGSSGTERIPVAATTNGAATVAPPSVRTVHSAASSL